MFRSSVRAVITVLFLASVVSAEIIDPVFLRGNKNLATGRFDHLTAFESASDMVGYQNPIWTQPMSNPNYKKSAFFDGTNYYWIDVKDEDLDLFYLHNYGPDLNNLLNDSGADTQVFHRSAGDSSLGPGTWFADSEGGIYSYFEREWDTQYPGTDLVYIQYFRRYASIADVLADNGTTSAPDYDGYNWEDRFFAVNGKFYRTNTGSNTGNGDLLGVAAYNSFDDLVAKRQAESYGGGVGSAYDLFMVVPRAALGLTGMPSPVPEIDPAGIGSTLGLIGGCLSLLERRRKRT